VVLGEEIEVLMWKWNLYLEIAVKRSNMMVEQSFAMYLRT